ncbi:hypothetical protein thsrh120_61370 [Rhizobium sp. No.120]
MLKLAIDADLHIYGGQRGNHTQTTAHDRQILYCCRCGLYRDRRAFGCRCFGFAKTGPRPIDEIPGYCSGYSQSAYPQKIKWPS